MPVDEPDQNEDDHERNRETNLDEWGLLHDSPGRSRPTRKLVACQW